MTAAQRHLSVAPDPVPTDGGPRRIPPRLMVVWVALFLNVLAFSGLPTVFPIPGIVGQLLTQGALPGAVVLAVCANRRVVVRPNVFLLTLTVVAVVALMVSIHNEFMFGSVFRASRYLMFLTVLWLLTPWFGRRDMMLLRCYRVCLGSVLGLVLLGAVLSPGLAFAFEGRLAGVIWPVPATQVAHYAAVLLGTTVVLWMCRVISGRNALVGVLTGVAILVATHTRTASVAAIVALLCAAASLFLSQRRVRRASLLGGLVAVAASAVFASELTAWALRGQTAQEAGQLTGRTKVWSNVIHAPRPALNDVFGSGLSNLSWNGLPIDSNWVATYLDLGWFGLVAEAGLILFLLIAALVGERGPQRAVAIFLIIYCLFASLTETGLSQPSPYLLDLAVAASLLVRPSGRSR